jgi:hypothetical protein
MAPPPHEAPAQEANYYQKNDKAPSLFATFRPGGQLPRRLVWGGLFFIWHGNSPLCYGTIIKGQGIALFLA